MGPRTWRIPLPELVCTAFEEPFLRIYPTVILYQPNLIRGESLLRHGVTVALWWFVSDNKAAGLLIINTKAGNTGFEPDFVETVE